ncbi:chitinase [Klenkia soli]|uniref:Chitinase n=1 Tax=Klenkia soli TaxID=1052260 RepID=A0A1H0PBD8_9ACTN|nr:chitinase [Klenkia soli]SDP01978.1 chitinase [Klenkia soli]
MTPSTPPTGDPVDEQPPARRLSWPRLALLVAALGGVTAAAVVQVDDVRTPDPAPASAWHVPYVDVTLTPTFQFQDPAANPARTVALAFVVADPDAACSPSWGGYYSLDGAGQDLDLDRRITQLRSAGGDVVVSFGGLTNEELSVACTDEEALTDAYRDVVERYDLSSVDMDVEGTAVADQAAADRRARALATVQAERRAEDRPLSVWLTLPVTPDGLTADGLALVGRTLDGGVDLAGVNVMTMDYGGSKAAGTGMLAAAEDALTATAAQLGDAYEQRGEPLDDADLWAHLGATPMIGQNDVDGEVFTVDDATGLTTFARERGLGRLSMWSINRDQPCGASFADVAVHSNTCSGVTQDPLAFTTAFGRIGSPGATGTVTEVVRQDTRQPVLDDPTTSPYPIWRAEAQYPAGYKVVWHGQVYEARWYASGIDPSTTGSGTPSPWTLLGAVTTTEAAPEPVPSVTDVTDAWDPATLYTRGARVVFDGLPYEARWTNQATSPGVQFPIGPDEPWAPLFTIPGEPTGS